MMADGGYGPGKAGAPVALHVGSDHDPPGLAARHPAFRPCAASSHPTHDCVVFGNACFPPVTHDAASAGG